MAKASWVTIAGALVAWGACGSSNDMVEPPEVPSAASEPPAAADPGPGPAPGPATPAPGDLFFEEPVGATEGWSKTPPVIEPPVTTIEGIVATFERDFAPLRDRFSRSFEVFGGTIHAANVELEGSTSAWITRGVGAAQEISTGPDEWQGMFEPYPTAGRMTILEARAHPFIHVVVRFDEDTESEAAAKRRYEALVRQLRATRLACCKLVERSRKVPGVLEARWVVDPGSGTQTRLTRELQVVVRMTSTTRLAEDGSRTPVFPVMVVIGSRY